MSGSQNRSCCNIIYRLGLNIVMLLTLLLSMLLFAGSFLTTCYADNMETQQVLLRPDNPLWNLLELAGFGLLFSRMPVSMRQRARTASPARLFLLWFRLWTWGPADPLDARFPQRMLCSYNAAAEWIWEILILSTPPPSYLSYYPQQIGLMVFLELLPGSEFTGLSAPARHFIAGLLVHVCLLCGRSGSNICRCNIRGLRITRRLRCRLGML